MRRDTLPAASNCASWSEQVEFYDDASQKMNLAAALDIIVTIETDDCRDRLQGSLVNGEVVMADDFLSITVSFTRSQMQSLRPMTYAIGARIIFDYDFDEQQAALGFLPVIEGV